ncbi:uncharacterized protein N0V89_000909 [Didymosphaeria variabile]|uniref:Phosphoglycerate mutase-like protein n=1 Tax=Didymosphaeria variabile TaxID=1932322 RepID=A0A9W9CG71_9PLEO|nr:uncharacterized protein N0V89_000909 [Didymosphaeria variabile]KAJ4360347.1 hypothetical protein N0V89_000909 [Didymosphaeria variabile]
MPKLISDSDMIYLRAAPIPRALESVQQAFYDETLFPNDGNCRRFAHLSRAFANRAAERWNETEDMQYLSKLFTKWMPGNHPVAVDSHPRLSGIMDTINATDAHGPKTKLPKEFYDSKARAVIDKIGVEEWFEGYKESAEYRMLGIGGLMGDVTSRMTGSIERNGNDGLVEIGGNDGDLGHGRGGETDIKLALSGCHDTTLAACLTSLGAFEGEKWPPFTSHIAFELFCKKIATTATQRLSDVPASAGTLNISDKKPQSWWASLFGNKKASKQSTEPERIARKPLADLTPEQRNEMKDYYVRIRYNDRIMQVPGCKPEGKHLDGDMTFCTLEAFKGIVDKYTPKNWKHACASNVDAPSFPKEVEPAGYE